MKKLFTLLFLSVLFSLSAQSDMRVNLWYGTISNEDIKDHLENEKYFKEVWQQQKDAGNLTNWEMWELINPYSDALEKTYLYIKMTTKENRENNKPVRGMPDGMDEVTWKQISDKHLSRFKKVFSVDTAYKGGFNNSAAEGKPANIAVINYMNVNWYKAYEYENMELKTFMPINKSNGMKAWGLTKVLNHFGADREVNYMTVDFYDDLEEVYERRSNTSAISKEVLNANKKMDQIRTLKSSDIFRLVDYLD
ncbi:MAG: hypothetical protein P8H87_07570 [Flavobacteriaceae bacterium]|jgi:hypothetical protein|nr:hypothetical protein [Flavobacteriaceae bacterium]